MFLEKSLKNKDFVPFLLVICLYVKERERVKERNRVRKKEEVKPV
jgi:hypothetical protein